MKLKGPDIKEKNVMGLISYWFIYYKKKMN